MADEDPWVHEAIRTRGAWRPSWDEALPQLVDEALWVFGAVAGHGRVRLTVRALCFPDEGPRRVDSHWIDTARADAGRRVARRLLERVLPTCGYPFDGVVEVVCEGEERRLLRKRLRVGSSDATIQDVYRREARRWAAVARAQAQEIRRKDRAMTQMLTDSGAVIEACAAVLERARQTPEAPEPGAPDPSDKVIAMFMLLGERILQAVQASGAARDESSVSPERDDVDRDVADEDPSSPWAQDGSRFDAWRMAGLDFEE